MKTRIKICCISSINEARAAIELGADALGLVGNMPSGPGIISNDKIMKISSIVPPPIDTFLLTCETDVNSIINHYKETLTTTIQLVNHLPSDIHNEIKNRLPYIRIVQVVHVEDRASLEYALSVEDTVHALLLDSGCPSAAVKELGGTGRVHDWEISSEIVNTVKKPVFLAGGIKPENIFNAICSVKPYGIDLCSGVRTAGKLDIVKLKQLIINAKKADKETYGI